MSTTIRALDEGSTAISGVEVRAPVTPAYAEILTPAALGFVAGLARRFEARRRELLELRRQTQAEIVSGRMPDFLDDTREIREGDWQVASIPRDLLDRRVEITGPVDRKMIINALNSGAQVYMADYEDANSPTWDNCIQGQLNVRDAVRRTIHFSSPEGKEYRLAEDVATLMVRPRGWHLVEKHVLVDGEPVSGSLFDFGLHFFHNARALMDRGSGPYFYLPKLESYLEARLWNDVFLAAQEELGIPGGTIRATVLIETILAAFQMHEILWELRGHSAGLNCGRWDYIFSVIKKFRHDPAWMLPNRAQVTMTTHMMHSYSRLCIQTCHQHGAHAIGGMAAFIPVKDQPEVNAEAIRQVEADKLREVQDGHDGTWVAHPGLVPIAREKFDEFMPGPNQIDRKRRDFQVTAADLLTVPQGTITRDGLRQNVSVGIQYLAAWLQGTGAAAINNLMEDVATAEISRAQVWQWLHHGASLDSGERLTEAIVRRQIDDERAMLKAAAGDGTQRMEAYEQGAELFAQVAVDREWVDFLTLVAYGRLP